MDGWVLGCVMGAMCYEMCACINWVARAGETRESGAGVRTISAHYGRDSRDRAVTCHESRHVSRGVSSKHCSRDDTRELCTHDMTV